MKNSVALVISIFMFGRVIAQTEHWDTYMASYEGKPGSVLVDMGRMETAPDKRFPYLVVSGPIAQKCDKQGLPDRDEINTLEQILETTGDFLTGLTPKMLVGTFMHNCERVNYYYVRDTMGIRTAIRRMYDRNFKNYQYMINLKYEPDWHTYRTFLYPDDAMLNWMDNDKVIAELIKSGDSLRVPRDVNFELYFHSDSARNAFRKFAETKGYTVKKETTSKGAPVIFAIVVAKHLAIKIEDINTLTAELKKETEVLRGEYMGWTAPLNGK